MIWKRQVVPDPVLRQRVIDVEVELAGLKRKYLDLEAALAKWIRRDRATPEPREREVVPQNGFSELSPAAARRMRALEARRAVRTPVQDQPS